MSTRLAAAVRAARTATGRGSLPAAVPEPPRDDARWPAVLLDPARALVPFMGRERELGELSAWAETDVPVSLRLLVAPAGFGKTRLGNELGNRLGEAGWTVVPVPHGREAATVRGRPPGDVLFVVDDAAARPGLAAMLDALARSARGRTRVLLLARVAGEWLRRLRWGSTLWARLGPGDATQTALDLPLSHDLTDDAVLQAAVTAFAGHLGVPDPDLGDALRAGPDPAGPDLSGRAAGTRVSDLHAAAALVALAAAGVPVPADEPSPLRALLDVAVASWAGSARDAGLELSLEEVQDVVAAACLLGVDDTAAARDVLRRVVPGLPVRAGARWLLGLPAAAGELGSGPGGSDRLGDLLVVDRLGRSVSMVGSCTWGLSRKAALRVVRVARRLEVELSELPAATALAAELLRRAADSAGDDPRTLRTAFLLKQRSVVDASVDDVVRGERLVATAKDAVGRAEALVDLGTALRDVARVSESLQILEAGVEAWRRIAAGDPDRYRTALVSAVNVLGSARWRAGNARDALVAHQEAVELCRAAPERDRGWCDAEKARVLISLNVAQNDIGTPQDEDESFAEMLPILRDLVERDPRQWSVFLSTALSNRSVTLTESRPPEALPFALEAVELSRQMVLQAPKRHRNELGFALTNLANAYAALGRDHEAVAPLAEAAAVRRELTRENPATHTWTLAYTLASLGAVRSRLGDLDEAIALEREAVLLRRRLAREQPARYRRMLAASLSNLAVTHSRAGEPEEALPLEREAVAIRRGLAKDGQPGEEHLAHSLSNLGVLYAELGRADDAVAPTKEAVDLLRLLATDDAGRFEPALADALLNLGAALIDAGRPEEGVEPTTEAVRLRRELARHSPDVHLPGLAAALTNLVSVHLDLGMSDPAAEYAQEVVNVRRRLVDGSYAHEQDLLRALDLQARVRRSGAVDGRAIR
ncbi:tetratricopeptide repeat protein [Promicromonospora sukumoe]|uniref:Tetratricopeptide (TPR) repeat protein n=1 Tax=Promicromonospora sukumoe TaxID=88382 RepID=A0A7W3PE36_9MICO|nr:tetratricopeptide repeat protein [Promicromonospora sukumoe]MBA8808635.1 tetratricopeptide (TPR) repeat protein [Promicromonospora sukumoe]